MIKIALGGGTDRKLSSAKYGQRRKYTDLRDWISILSLDGPRKGGQGHRVAYSGLIDSIGGYFYGK